MQVAALVTHDPTVGMDPMSRRALAQGVELAAAVGDGECTVVTVGAEASEPVLVDAIAWGRACSVTTDGVLVRDPQPDALDPTHTAQLLAATITWAGPFDLVLAGDRRGDDGAARTAAQVAELLDLPFVGPASFLSLQGNVLHVRSRRGRGFLQATVGLPAVVSCALDLISPPEPTRHSTRAVPRDRVRAVSAAEVGWHAPAEPHAATTVAGSLVGIVPDLDEPEASAALTAVAAAIAEEHGGRAVSLVPTPDDQLAEEDLARAVAQWSTETDATTIVVSHSSSGREVAGRLEVLLGRDTDVRMPSLPEMESVDAKKAVGVEVHALDVIPRRRVRIVSRPYSTSR